MGWGLGLCGKCCAGTPFQGSFGDCKSNAESGLALTMRDGSGNVLWTGTTSSTGLYSGSASISGDTAVTVTAAAPSVRFADTVVPATLHAGVSNVIPGVSLTPASGYACGVDPTDQSHPKESICGDPIKKTLNIASTSSGFPTSDTLVYGPSPSYVRSVIPYGWLGQTAFTLDGASWVYFFDGAGSLSRARPDGGGNFIIGSLNASSCNPVLFQTVGNYFTVTE